MNTPNADYPAMVAAARRAMIAVLQLDATDRVLVLGDPGVGRCSDAFADAAREVGCCVARLDLPADRRPLAAMPARMERALEDVTVVVNAVDGRSDEVPFRIEWIHAIEASGRIRMGHAPGITEDMMTGGALDVDYAAMAEREATLLRLLAGVDRVHITTELGTDLTLVIAGREAVSDLRATVRTGCNLPCGEVYCAPVEDGADGVMMVDGPVGGDGVPPRPIRIEVAGGQVTSVVCEDERWRALVQGYCDTDAGSGIIGELGIGLNPGARLAGRMLEDEKALGTLHVAFGDNRGMPGGANTSRMHIDYLMHRPTLTAWRGGVATAILKDGQLLG